jgi:DNA polymerase-1
MRKLLLVDSMGLLYRGHYALSARPLTAPDGFVTSGLSHLASEVLNLSGRLLPDYAAIVFDSPEKSFRAGIYEAYKANRPVPPDDLIAQMVMAPDLMEALGFRILRTPGFEADDLIASAAMQAADEGIRVTILTADKDLLQLASELISISQPGRPGKPGCTVGPAEVPRLLGVAPGQVVDYLALAGDSSDNVPGAKGIGPKTAQALLAKFSTLDAIYGAIDTVTPASVREKLLASRDRVMLSRDLVTLRLDSIPGLDVESLVIRPPDREKALSMLERLGLRRILGKISPAPRQAGIRSGTIQAPAADSRIPASAGASILALEPLGVRGEGPDARCEGFASSGGLVFSASEPGGLDDLRKLLERSPGICSSDAKLVLHLLRDIGVEHSVVAGDPVLADYVLSSGNPGRSLDHLCRDILGISVPPSADPLQASAASRAAACSKVCEVLEERLLADARLKGIYMDLEIPLIPVLASMEQRGMGLDREFLAVLREEFLQELRSLEDRAAGLAGGVVNLNSPARVSEVLFGRLGLPRIRKTGAGADSSGISVLMALSGMHPFVDLVIEHRELAKLLSTYLDKLPDFVSPRTGLIHTRFNQAVTATGRLSSSKPNLQNIPIRTERGRRIRRCFVPGRPGHVIVSADYSQIELRILAHMAGEGALREAYGNGEDIHSTTAVAIFGDASPEHRRKAKEVNFSIVYGISPHGLGRRLGVRREEAASMINRYFATYPEVDSFFRRCVDEAAASGETRTLLGRRRLFPDLAAARGNLRKGMERMVVNTTVQGSGADIVKLAMLAVHRRLAVEMPGAGLALQVHDELVVTVPRSLAEGARAILMEEMGRAFPLEVPLTADAGIGGNWLDAGAH